MPPLSEHEHRDELVVAAVAIGWGTLGPIVRWVSLPAVAIVFGRCVIGAVTLWAWRGARDRNRSPLAGATRGRVVASGAVLAVHWSTMFVALERAPVGVVILVIYLAPVFIALAAPLIGEQVRPTTWLALAIAVVGTVLVADPGGDIGSGVWWALGSSVAYAVVVLVDKTLAAEVGGLRLANSKLAVAGVLLLPLVVWADPLWSEASWGWLIVLGVVHTAFGLAVILDVLGRIPATVAAVLLYLEPASAVLFGWWWLGEQPT
ncbi:MAG TPA: DMT family transporter, partial [Microthrixaceae bacterium]|nr:DMT family transporter [Microthrixaceae bacterium]